MSRIVYVGNRKNLASDGKSFNTEQHIFKTLESLGHEVNFIQEDELEPGTLSDRVGKTDLFLWTRTWRENLTLDDLNNLKARGILTVSFHLDCYSQIERNGGLGEDVFWATDYVFSPEGSVQAKRVFESLGINQRYLPPAVYKDECYLSDFPTYIYDVVFVGGGSDYAHPEWNSYRNELIDFLRNTYGDRFGKFGHPEQTIRGEALNNLYAQSKIVIGDSLCKDFIDSYYTSDRPFETTGRGGMLITPYIPGISDFFVDRKEAVFYAFGNWVQLKNLIDYYLENEIERVNIQIAGHRRTLKDHTYHNRLTLMLEILKKEGAL